MAKKYQIESTQSYGIKKEYDMKTEAVTSIKSYLQKGFGNHFYLHSLNSKGKYQTIEDYFKIKTGINRSKIKREIRRKLSDLD